MRLASLTYTTMPDPSTNLSASEKNARMNEERSTLTKLLEASLEGRLKDIKTVVDAYQQRHSNLSVEEILSQFKDAKGKTCLHFLCQSEEESSSDSSLLRDFGQWIGSSSSMQKLVTVQDSLGLTPLHYAVQSFTVNKADVVLKRMALLLQHNPDLASILSHSGVSVLHHAASTTAAIVNQIVQVAPKLLNKVSKQGGTPLHWACPLQGDFTASTISALVQAGADVNAVNESSLTPLLLAAAAANDVHACYLVQEAGADCKVTLPGNVNILHICADCNLFKTMAAVMEKSGGAEPLKEQANAQGQRPMDCAVRENHVLCVMMLMDETSETKALDFINHYKLPAESAASPTTTCPQAAPDAISELEVVTKNEVAALMASATVSDKDSSEALEFKSKGNSSFQTGRWQEAIELYSTAISLNPLDATFYSNRSACYMHLKEHKEALRDAVKCRQLKPSWPKAAYRMALARCALHRYEDAALSAWEGLQLDEKNAELKKLLQDCVEKGRQAHLKLSGS